METEITVKENKVRNFVRKHKNAFVGVLLFAAGAVTALVVQKAMEEPTFTVDELIEVVNTEA